MRKMVYIYIYIYFLLLLLLLLFIYICVKIWIVYSSKEFNHKNFLYYYYKIIKKIQIVKQ